MFAQLTILMLAGLLGPLLAFGRRGLIPVVIGELIAGFVLGRTGFGVIDSASQPLPVLSAIGFAMLMFTAGTHVDIGSPAIRQGFARGVLALAVVAVTAIPIGLLLDHSLAIGHPALIAVIITGSSAAIAFPIIEERKLAGPNVAFLIAWVALAELGDRGDHAADAGKGREPARGDRWRRRDHRSRGARALHRHSPAPGRDRRTDAR